MVQMSTVWDRTTAFAGAALGAIVPIALVLLFVPVSIQLAITPLVAKQDPAVQIVVMFVFWIVELLGTLSLIALVLGGMARPAEAVRAALARLGPAVAIFILLGILVGIASIPFAIVMANAGMNMTLLKAGNIAGMGTLGAGSAWFLLIYALVLVVVGIWITARLLVIEPVILAERRGIGAIARAFRLTRGLALKIVGVLILYSIVATVAVWAAQAVFGSIFALIASNDGDIGIATVLTSIIVAAVSTAFKVIAALFIAKLYQAIGESDEPTLELA
jgi:hypothetical protein